MNSIIVDSLPIFFIIFSFMSFITVDNFWAKYVSNIMNMLIQYFLRQRINLNQLKESQQNKREIYLLRVACLVSVGNQSKGF